jgi:hypothetical protein
LEGLNVRLAFSEGETARLSGQKLDASNYKVRVAFARPATNLKQKSLQQVTRIPTRRWFESKLSQLVTD